MKDPVVYKALHDVPCPTSLPLRHIVGYNTENWKAPFLHNDHIPHVLQLRRQIKHDVMHFWKDVTRYKQPRVISKQWTSARIEPTTLAPVADSTKQSGRVQRDLSVCINVITRRMKDCTFSIVYRC